MLGKLLSGGEFGQWASFVTPAFFNVMPTKALWQSFKELARGTRDRDLYARVVRERQALLARSSLAITLEGAVTGRARTRGEAPASASASEGALSAETRATRVVTLYFHQILHGDTTLLDLRQQAFSDRHPFVWRPAAWIARWDDEFIAALRQVYAGFYRDDTASYQAGLRALNLTHADDVFRQHFGGVQRAVRFEVKQFVSTFHQVFVRCRDSGTSLHPDFLLLGLCLASLFEHVEALGASVDATAAYERAAILEPLPLAAGAAG